MYSVFLWIGGLPDDPMKWRCPRCGYYNTTWSWQSPICKDCRYKNED